VQDSFDRLRPYISDSRLRDLHHSLRQGGLVKEFGKKIGWNTARDFRLLDPSARKGDSAAGHKAFDNIGAYARACPADLVAKIDYRNV
jgi:hypothetical protein